MPKTLLSWVPELRMGHVCTMWTIKGPSSRAFARWALQMQPKTQILRKTHRELSTSEPLKASTPSALQEGFPKGLRHFLHLLPLASKRGGRGKKGDIIGCNEIIQWMHRVFWNSSSFFHSVLQGRFQPKPSHSIETSDHVNTSVFSCWKGRLSFLPTTKDH